MASSTVAVVRRRPHEGIAALVATSGRPLFSIGAVARMLGLSQSTIRTWEARYGLVTPDRSPGGQRLYSREQVEQLRYLKDEVGAGRRPAEAHRLLAERLVRGDSFGERPATILVAVDGDADAVARVAALVSPGLVVLDTEDPAYAGLVAGIRAEGRAILPLALLDRPSAWPPEAKALLQG